MASCIFHGLCTTRKGQDAITVSGPHPDKLQHFAAQGAKITSDNVQAARDNDIIFLGVKPQMLTGVLQELADAGVDCKDKLIVSMAAGFRSASIARLLHTDRIIRIMPNTPSRLGLGVTGFYAGPAVSAEDAALVRELLRGMGTLIDCKDEEGINAVGALAGSAPAFMYRFLEALIDESIRRGFEPAAARAMIAQMATGTAAMVQASPDTPVSALREAVTSKGGTTFEGLQVMTQYHFEEMMHEVIEAAMRKTHLFETMF